MALRLTLRLSRSQHDTVDCLAEAYEIGDGHSQIGRDEQLRDLGTVSEKDVSAGNQQDVADTVVVAEAHHGIGKNQRGIFGADYGWQQFNGNVLSHVGLPRLDGA